MIFIELENASILVLTMNQYQFNIKSLISDTHGTQTISTGSVLNYRSCSAGKYRIGLIWFLVDHAFSI